MQTFLPFPSFTDSARALDWRRLGNQRLEAWRILQTLTGASSGWAHHPAVKMWRGSERALCVYGITVCDEWIRRGYRDTMRERFADEFQRFAGSTTPPWLGATAFHLSHQSNLIRKLPEHYGPLFPGVPSDLPYVWPTPKESTA